MSSPPQRPLCFVLMPFGTRVGDAGRSIDFDAIYGTFIKPAIEAAELQPIRADEEQAAGIIHKPMFERLILCDYAVADLTIANANVFYELGIRHAIRPHSTVSIVAEGTWLPSDLGSVRTMPYRLDASGAPADAAADGDSLTGLLNAARGADTDSPLFQLVNEMGPPDVSRLKTDVFRDRVAYSEDTKTALATARIDGVEAIREIADGLGPLEDVESGVLIDLMISYRAVKAWQEMIDLVDSMPEPLRRTVMVREQYALALNREGRGEEAERELRQLIADRGPSSETSGILGRIYKDRWQEAHDGGNALRARGLLKKAIGEYLKGFETDWRDAYPGINAVTLMAISDPPDPRLDEIVPVVTYSVKRRLEAGEPDYWDHATLLELAVIGRDEELAGSALADALASVREVWEPETTLRNLRLIGAARAARDELPDWHAEIEGALEEAMER